LQSPRFHFIASALRLLKKSKYSYPFELAKALFMGHTIWIDVDGRSGTETHHDMGVLHRLDKHLDALAEKLGVTRLTAFYDYRELNAAYDEAGEELPGPEWFDSAKGLEAFTALRLRLEEDWDAINWKPDKSEQHWPQSLMDDLRFCESLLEQAVLKGQRFRLMIVP